LEDPPPVYDLFAVANHIGHSGHGGHYTAFCKNYDSRRWAEFNDGRVTSSIPPERIDGRKAYLLFFGKQGLLD